MCTGAAGRAVFARVHQQDTARPSLVLQCRAGGKQKRILMFTALFSPACGAGLNTAERREAPAERRGVASLGATCRATESRVLRDR